jgi:hypothetical protein
MRKWMPAFVLGFAAATALHAGAALAQDDPERARPQRRPPLRIEVAPPSQLYRQCTDWYVIEQRAAGPTVVPQTRCRWAVRR